MSEDPAPYLTLDHERLAHEATEALESQILSGPKAQLRIEALRASAQIAPAIISSDEDVARVAREDTPIATKAILAMAKDFAKWLETGE